MQPFESALKQLATNVSSYMIRISIESSSMLHLPHTCMRAGAYKESHMYMRKGSVTTTHAPTRTHKESYRATKRPECTALVWCVKKDGVDPREVWDLLKHITTSPGDLRKPSSHKRLIICVKRFWSNTLIVVGSSEGR